MSTAAHHPYRSNLREDDAYPICRDSSAYDFVFVLAIERVCALRSRAILSFAERILPIRDCTRSESCHSLWWTLKRFNSCFNVFVFALKKETSYRFEQRRDEEEKYLTFSLIFRHIWTWIARMRFLIVLNLHNFQSNESDSIWTAFPRKRLFREFNICLTLSRSQSEYYRFECKGDDIDDLVET